MFRVERERRVALLEAEDGTVSGRANDARGSRQAIVTRSRIRKNAGAPRTPAFLRMRLQIQPNICCLPMLFWGRKKRLIDYASCAG